MTDNNTLVTELFTTTTTATTISRTLSKNDISDQITVSLLMGLKVVFIKHCLKMKVT